MAKSDDLMAAVPGGMLWYTPLKGFFWAGESNPAPWECRSVVWAASMLGGKGKLFLILLSPVSLYLSVAFPEYFSLYFITGLTSLKLGDCCHCTHSHLSYLIQSLWVLRKDFPQHFHCCWHLDQHPKIFIWHFPFPINLWNIPPKMVWAGNALSSI